MKNNFTWNKESEYSIYDSFDDWGSHYFACVMKDGNLTEFIGCLDEGYDGETGEVEIFKHVDNTDDKYSTDDIVMWIEIPNIEKKG